MSNALFVGRVPKYRHHKPSGQAVVTLSGKDQYLGPWKSKASRAEYDRLIGEWLAAGRSLPKPEAQLTVAELALRYLNFAKRYYRQDGEPTRSLERVKTSIRVLKESYAYTLVGDFGPLALQALQHKLATSGLSRRYVNYLIDTIRRMFKWGVSQEIVPETVYRALTAVTGLRAGRTEAREMEPIGPVEDAVVEATLPYLSPIVADMVRFQQATGCRPAEVCAIRPCDIDTSGHAWIYTPRRHKTQYRGHKRIIFIGPRGQDVLRPYLLRPAESHCFSPADNERKRRAELHLRRVTPLSCGNRPGTNRKRRAKKQPGDCYTSRSYHAAVRHAILKANEQRAKDRVEERIARWHPNQLRHSAATEIRKHFGLEAVQAVLGHKNMVVSEVYAEKNLALAAEVMRKIG
jgi:integrase